ncbi:MAG: (2Fe-2S)-binding protein [Actinomycetia bacterium]|nr:(2Fe-2S)-binding protein [Actinomycetes bacterium]
MDQATDVAPIPIAVTVNGQLRRATVEPRLLLAHFLRDTLGLTGTHIGCNTAQCGVCTVLLDGRPVKSCNVLAVQADGASVVTVEGLARDGELNPVQEAFWAKHGLQCGFCTPGAQMLAAGILAEDPHPTEAAVREALDGLYCRCTGYENIVRAVRYAAELMSGAAEAKEGA